ncbi:MAG: hypothetical protein ACYDER_28285 [Ktedonobacteraceae bacterium]
MNDIPLAGVLIPPQSFASVVNKILQNLDQQRICDFNAIAKKEYKIHVEVLPEPYTGNPDAPVLLLNLNPGFYEKNAHFLTGNEYFTKTSRANAMHEQLEYPFYLFDPDNADSPGYYW